MNKIKNWVESNLIRILGDKYDLIELDGEVCIEFFNTPKVYIFLSDAADASDSNATYVAKIINSKNLYIDLADEFVKTHLNAADVEINTRPQFLFRLNECFDLHFQAGDSEFSDQDFIVSFKNEKPVSFEWVREIDQWFDEDSGTWIKG